MIPHVSERRMFLATLEEKVELATEPILALAPDPDYEKYEELKRKFLAAHPDASAVELEDAARWFATLCGL